MKLSAAIMAHPVRSDTAEQVRAALDRDVDIVYDTEPEPSPDPRQRWATGKRAWQAHDPAADWHLVLQDDVHVSADLLAGLEVALSVLGPEGLFSAYTGTGRPDQANVRRALAAADKGAYAWMCTKSLNWGPAILAPVATIPDMLKWCSHSSKSRINYDARVGRFYRDVLKWRTWYTVPSLVDHADVPSLIGHGGDRHAHMMHTASALDVDWSRVPPAGLPVRWDRSA